MNSYSNDQDSVVTRGHHRALGRRSLVAPSLVVASLFALAGCSSDVTPAASTTGGTVASGGSVAVQGGSTSQGGTTSTMGGGTATGGASGSAGAATASGGAAGSVGKGCPAQKSTAAVPAGTDPMQAAGTPVAGTATRPQLTEAEANAVHTILQAFKSGGDFAVQGAGGAGGAGGTAGGGGTSGSSGGGGAPAGGAGMSGGGTSGAGASSGGATSGAGTSGGGGASAGASSGGTAGAKAAPPPAGGGAGGNTSGGNASGGKAGGSSGGKSGSGGESGGSSGGASGASSGGASGASGASGGGAGGTSGASGAAGANAGGSAGAGNTGRGTVVYTKNDNWDPLTNGIGNVNEFVPTFTVAADGTGTHTKVQDAINAAILLADCARAYIRLMPGTYREIITVPSKSSAPPITLYSTDPDPTKTVIVKGNSAGGSPEGDAIAKGTSGSATFTQSSQDGFQAKNITIANDYTEGTIPGNDQEGVALLNQGDRAQYENVRILGNSFTLYVKSTKTAAIARSYFRDSYIEGDETIIAGRGTAVFDHCQIHSIGKRVTTGGLIAAASTELDNPHGLLFISSKFTADPGTTGVSLGRQWYESSRQQAVGKIIIRNSTLGEHFNKASPWLMVSNRMTPKEAVATTPIYSSDDYFPAGQGWTPKELFLAEYGNTGPGATP